jgi:hypothetical protein
MLLKFHFHSAYPNFYGSRITHQSRPLWMQLTERSAAQPERVDVLVIDGSRYTQKILMRLNDKVLF